MKFRPLNDNVLVRFEKDPEKIGSIFVPDGAGSPRPIDVQWADVIEAGPGHYGSSKCPGCHGRFVPTTVKPGDRVAVDSKLAGQPWKIDGEEYRVVRESEIHLVEGREAT